MSDVEIRPARAEDVDAILDLIEDVAAEGRWIGHEVPLDRSGMAEDARRGIAADDEHHVVAVAEGRIVGHLLGTDRRGRVSFGMFVAAAARGRGAGRALLRDLLGWARRRGAHKVDLEVWPHNAPAIALYAAEGFVVEGRRVRQYRRRSGELWDSLIMGLVLDDRAPGSGLPDAPVPARERP